MKEEKEEMESETPLKPDMQIVEKILLMGFTLEKAQKAAV